MKWKYFSSDYLLSILVFVVRPNNLTCTAQGLVKGGSGRRAIAQMSLAASKNAPGSVGIPQKGALQAPGYKLPFQGGSKPNKTVPDPRGGLTK